MAEANWYVVHTYSGYENKLKVDIEKTIKNETEIKGFQNAVVKDGVALTKFYIWLEKQMAEGAQVCRAVYVVNGTLISATTAIFFKWRLIRPNARRYFWYPEAYSPLMIGKRYSFSVLYLSITPCICGVTTIRISCFDLWRE